ncbi:MAG: FHA domain-containing protein [Microbacterium sp.]
MQTIYRPGNWYLIALPGALVALPPAVSADLVTRLWERLREQQSFATVVDVLASQAGGAVASLPSFAAAVVEGTGVRIALRGGATAHVDTASGTQDFSGADVTTWSERFVGGASHVELMLDSADGDVVLPVQSGVVRAATVTAELESGDDPVAAPSIAEPSRPIEEPAPLPPAPEAIAEPAPLPPGPVPIAEPEPSVIAEPEPGVIAEPEPVAEPAPSVIAEAQPTGDADQVDGATLAPTDVTLAPSSETVDDLWGATVISARKADTGADAPSPPAVEAEDLGDHDGATISLAELRAQRRDAAPSADVPTAAMPAASAPVGRVRVSTGQVVALDRTVIIGRRPRSTRASGANLPHLIAVDSPQQDISRSHLEIRPEGDTVVVIDLHTTNGSTLLRTGADPMRLHPGEQTLVLSGDVIDLGDGVKVSFEDLP